jgi:AcrR family transcriptional regulator
MWASCGIGLRAIQLNAYAQSMTDGQTRRRYTLRARAERQAATHGRILDAALARYGEVGPARATISGVADRAGVQRLTVYRHFPDEDALVAGAVQRLLDLAPMPDMRAWFHERNARDRLTRALVELHAWYADAGPALGPLLHERDGLPAIRAALRGLLEPLDQLPGALAEGWPTFGQRGRERLRASIRHARQHDTWRSLRAEGGLSQDETVGTLVLLAIAAAQGEAFGAGRSAV